MHKTNKRKSNLRKTRNRKKVTNGRPALSQVAIGRPFYINVLCWGSWWCPPACDSKSEKNTRVDRLFANQQLYLDIFCERIFEGERGNFL